MERGTTGEMGYIKVKGPFQPEGTLLEPWKTYILPSGEYTFELCPDNSYNNAKQIIRIRIYDSTQTLWYELHKIEEEGSISPQSPNITSETLCYTTPWLSWVEEGDTEDIYLAVIGEIYVDNELKEKYEWKTRYRYSQPTQKQPPPIDNFTFNIQIEPQSITFTPGETAKKKIKIETSGAIYVPQCTIMECTKCKIPILNATAKLDDTVLGTGTAENIYLPVLFPPVNVEGPGPTIEIDIPRPEKPSGTYNIQVDVEGYAFYPDPDSLAKCFSDPTYAYYYPYKTLNIKKTTSTQLILINYPEKIEIETANTSQHFIHPGQKEKIELRLALLDKYGAYTCIDTDTKKVRYEITIVEVKTILDQPLKKLTNPIKVAEGETTFTTQGYYGQILGPGGCSAAFGGTITFTMPKLEDINNEIRQLVDIDGIYQMKLVYNIKITVLDLYGKTYTTQGTTEGYYETTPPQTPTPTPTYTCTVTVTADKTEVKPGDTVTVTVKTALYRDNSTYTAQETVPYTVNLEVKDVTTGETVTRKTMQGEIQPGQETKTTLRTTITVPTLEEQKTTLKIEATATWRPDNKNITCHGETNILYIVPSPPKPGPRPTALTCTLDTDTDTVRPGTTLHATLHIALDQTAPVDTPVTATLYYTYEGTQRLIDRKTAIIEKGKRTTTLTYTWTVPDLGLPQGQETTITLTAKVAAPTYGLKTTCSREITYIEPKKPKPTTPRCTLNIYVLENGKEVTTVHPGDTVTITVTTQLTEKINDNVKIHIDITDNKTRKTIYTTTLTATAQRGEAEARTTWTVPTLEEQTTTLTITATATWEKAATTCTNTTQILYKAPTPPPKTTKRKTRNLLILAAAGAALIASTIIILRRR